VGVSVAFFYLEHEAKLEEDTKKKPRSYEESDKVIFFNIMKF
jgi:hypothetical protein